MIPSLHITHCLTQSPVAESRALFLHISIPMYTPMLIYISVLVLSLCILLFLSIFLSLPYSYVYSYSYLKFCPYPIPFAYSCPYFYSPFIPVPILSRLYTPVPDLSLNILLLPLYTCPYPIPVLSSASSGNVQMTVSPIPQPCLPTSHPLFQQQFFLDVYFRFVHNLNVKFTFCKSMGDLLWQEDENSLNFYGTKKYFKNRELC